MSNKQIKPLVILAMLMLLIMILGTTVAHVILHLFGVWSLTASSLIFPLSFIVNVLLGECYGKQETFFVFLTAIFFSLIFGFFSYSMIPIAAKFVIFGTIGSILGFTVNTLIVTYKPLKKQYSFPVRYFASTGAGEFVLVTIVTWGAFLPTHSFSTVTQIWVFSFTTKILLTFILAIPVRILANFITIHYALSAK